MNQNGSTESKTRVAAIIMENGKLLMVKGVGFLEIWTPGGTIDEGESDEGCLRRELREEIGVEVLSFHFFREYSGKSFYGTYQLVQKVYIVSISGEVRLAAEIESFVWLSRNDFENKKFLMMPIDEEEIIPDLIKQGIF